MAESMNCKTRSAAYLHLRTFMFPIPHSQEHKHLLKILFANELQKSQCAPFTWNGEFSKEVSEFPDFSRARMFACVARNSNSNVMEKS